MADALAKCVLLLGENSAAALRHYDADGFLIEGDAAIAVDTSPSAVDLHSTRHGSRTSQSVPGALALPLRGRTAGGRLRGREMHATADQTGSVG